ncbi:hypothetical protein VNI00_007363 [Paramarasmius palmivorus]|uniref:Mid2 domain-containing protein n=1 Tax=Paramarasmius palmivorus TaxID=297713 RepID=A0AAW0D0B1_9AGAR
MSTQRGSGSSYERRNWSSGIDVGSAVGRSSWAPTSATLYLHWTGASEDTPTTYRVKDTLASAATTTASPTVVNNRSDDQAAGQSSTNDGSTVSPSSSNSNSTATSTTADPNSTGTAGEDTATPSRPPVRANAPGEETTELVTSTISIESTITSGGSVVGTTTILSTSTGTVVRTIPPGPSSASIPAGASSQNVPAAMIGGIVGGVVALILSAILIFCLVRRRRKRTIEFYNATPYSFSVAGAGVQSNTAGTSDWIQSPTSEHRVSPDDRRDPSELSFSSDERVSA